MSVPSPNSTDMKPELLRTHEVLIAMAATVLMILPFITIFSDALDSMMMQIEAYVFLQNIVAPIEGRMIAVILQYVFGIPSVMSGSTLSLIGQPSLKVYISWICLGWQSAALLAITFVAGLRGPYTTKSKILVLLAGIEGTFLINLLRITSVVLVDLYVGYLPATLYHDYGGTIIVINWLVVFWYLAFTYILKRKSPEN